MITDEWFNDGFQVFEKLTKENYHIIRVPLFVGTTNGPRHLFVGDYIITNPNGERYPMTPELFAELKNDLGDGVCVSKPSTRMAKLADHSGTINTSRQEILKYSKDNDFIVRLGPDDYAIIKKDIFEQFYEIGEQK